MYTCLSFLEHANALRGTAAAIISHLHIWICRWIPVDFLAGYMYMHMHKILNLNAKIKKTKHRNACVTVHRDIFLQCI